MGLIHWFKDQNNYINANELDNYPTVWTNGFITY